jgi:hypothetical protein
MDGDTLFAKALLTVARQDKPRDGGAAVGALADWLQEQMDEQRPFVALGDAESTGFVLILMKWLGHDYPLRATFLATEESKTGDDIDRESFADFGAEFRVWFCETAHAFWEAAS